MTCAVTTMTWESEPEEDVTHSGPERKMTIELEDYRDGGSYKFEVRVCAQHGNLAANGQSWVALEVE